MEHPPTSAPPPAPLFRAVASSTRPLCQLLKCISFSNKVHVEIGEDGIRFSADHARVMQGAAHWNKALFTSYITNFSAKNQDDDEPNAPVFQLSLLALLESLQIFGAVDAAARQAKAEVDPYRSNLRNLRNNRPDAFTNQTLGMPGSCSLSYIQEGDPFRVHLDEASVNTTCNLVTYLPEAPEQIPFDVKDLSFKIIMQARWLLDALTEIAPTSPEKLTIMATPTKPYLKFTSSGTLASSTVDFAKGRALIETFSVPDRWVHTFKFDMIKFASEAMRIASKVSLRGDGQGVLSMQFMVEAEGGVVNFLDFRFVPYATHEDDDDDEEDSETFTNDAVEGGGK